MPKSLLPLAALLLAGCAATTANQMTRGEPFKTYSSARQRDDIAQCIARSLPYTSVLPGRTETIVNQMNFEGPLTFTWIVTDAPGGGSVVRLWRANAIAGGVSAAESCF